MPSTKVAHAWTFKKIRKLQTVEMNKNITTPEKKTSRNITYNHQNHWILMKQTKTKPQETLNFKLKNPDVFILIPFGISKWMDGRIIWFRSIKLTFQYKWRKLQIRIYFVVEIEENAEWIDTIVFEDDNDESSVFAGMKLLQMNDSI